MAVLFALAPEPVAVLLLVVAVLFALAPEPVAVLFALVPNYLEIVLVCFVVL